MLKGDCGSRCATAGLKVQSSDASMSSADTSPILRAPKVSWLIIELDGGQHTEQTRYDDKRTEFLRGRGFRVLRFWDNDVLRDTGAVLESIRLALIVRPPP